MARHFVAPSPSFVVKRCPWHSCNTSHHRHRPSVSRHRYQTIEPTVWQSPLPPNHWRSFAINKKTFLQGSLNRHCTVINIINEYPKLDQFFTRVTRYTHELSTTQTCDYSHHWRIHLGFDRCCENPVTRSYIVGIIMCLLTNGKCLNGTRQMRSNYYVAHLWSSLSRCRLVHIYKYDREVRSRTLHCRSTGYWNIRWRLFQSNQYTHWTNFRADR
jgi:hypothetical protein